MDKHPFKSLSEIAEELHCSHETARRAALKGKIPAFQPFGKHTVWCVAPNYESFLNKSAASDHPEGDAASDDTITKQA
jgi:hypothetical protein